MPLGSHPGESSILTAAGRHFACSVGGLVAIEGSFDGYLLRCRLTQRGFDVQQMRRHGLMHDWSRVWE